MLVIHIYIHTYLQGTNFDNVKVLRAKSLVVRGMYYYVTFQAFSPQGVATTFQTKIHYFFPHPCSKIEFVFVRIIPDDSPSDSDDFTDKSKKYRPTIGHPKDRPYRKRLEAQINVCFPCSFFTYGSYCFYVSVCLYIYISEYFRILIPCCPFISPSTLSSIITLSA